MIYILEIIDLMSIPPCAGKTFKFVKKLKMLLCLYIPYLTKHFYLVSKKFSRKSVAKYFLRSNSVHH